MDIISSYIPSMLRVVCKVVDLADSVGDDTIGGHQIFWLNGTTVT
jgi:hypothetical protein